MKKIAQTSGTISAAAALSLGLTACGSQPGPPPPVPPTFAPGGGTEGATTAEPTTSAEPASTPGKLDCQGKDALKEECGYKSPTKYAALDPDGIRNA